MIAYLAQNEIRVFLFTPLRLQQPLKVDRPQGILLRSRLNHLFQISFSHSISHPLQLTKPPSSILPTFNTHGPLLVLPPLLLVLQLVKD